ncbi:uncharacterized protein LOC111047997 [Nilaparvata lugens]|uniref:uncharacterized protein LOC111047997 n=1 Tax=Nilaparvata lugens TaxID=108931 RepID=UPI00193E00BC|nr:uncharacterized protein LOC111047997 [Nilaparvata lugens]
MRAFKVPILFLLIFAGSQRAAIAERTTTTEEPPEDVTSESMATNEDLEPDLRDCRSEDTRQQIELIMKMLGTNDSKVISQTDMENTSDEAVLVVGERGSGKTSLIQFLIGNEKLVSNIIEGEKPSPSLYHKTAEHVYSIDDGEKIGIAADNHSFTQYPEIVNFNGINFIDTQGFEASRSPADEIIAITVKKKILKKFKKAKILFLVNYSKAPTSSLTVNLVYSFSRIHSFVELGRYANNTAIIITNVPFVLEANNDDDDNDEEDYNDEDDNENAGHFVKKHNKTNQQNRKVTSEPQVVDNTLADIIFSLYLVQSIVDPVVEVGKEPPGKVREIEKKRDIMSLIDSIEYTKKKLNILRVNEFHQPYRVGALHNMTLFEKDRKSLFEMIENLEPIEIRQQDFNFTLSRQAETLKKCLKQVTLDDYRNKYGDLFCMEENTTKETKLTESYKEKWEKTVGEVNSLYDKITNLGINLEDDDYYYGKFPLELIKLNCTGYTYK